MRQVILLALVLPIFNSGPAPAKFPLTGQAPAAFVEHPFDFAIGATRKDVLKSLDTPIKEDTSTRQNPHDPTVTDVFHTLQYEGLEVRIGEFPGASPPTSGRILVVLTNDKYKLKHQLHVGSSKKDVQRVLGWPETDFHMATWSYQGDDAGYLCLSFKYRNEQVPQIEWSQNWD